MCIKQNTKRRTSLSPSILLFGIIYPKEIKSTCFRESSNLRFIMAVLRIAKTGKSTVNIVYVHIYTIKL